MAAIEKKIVVDEQGRPLEVILSWKQFCELMEQLGYDLDEEAQGDLRAARKDLQKSDPNAFIPLSEL